MTRPRKELICIDDTPYYHIVSRCVRRTFLCGFDPQTQRDYEHRRQWIVDRLRLLSSLFAIDICAYAVMNNHYHLVVKLNPKLAKNWSHDDVIQRWTCLYKGPLLIQRQQSGENLSLAEQAATNEVIAVWHKRLTNLSWFMKCLNEPIAREANKEDKCTGHFWESRYKSQALLSEKALLSCMAYVDLNPIRAKIAETPETSDYTSLQARIRSESGCNPSRRALTSNEDDLAHDLKLTLKPLLAFSGNTTIKEQAGIPFDFIEYLKLVDWTGRVVRNDKRGAIPYDLPPILERLAISSNDWIENTQAFEQIHSNKFKPPKHHHRAA